jgi:hypothetical protein
MQRSGGLRFKVSPGKEFIRPYLEKCPVQNRVNRVAQVIEPA